MMAREGMRWCTAVGALGLALGAWAQPVGVRSGTQLVTNMYDYYAECQNPDTELCSVSSPHPSLYMYTVLTPDIPFDDLGAHWVVDLRKFPPVRGAVKVLRVATSTGDVHAIRLKLLYDKAALAGSARKPAPVAASSQPTAMPQSAMPNSTAKVVNTPSKPGVGVEQVTTEPGGKPAAPNNVVRTGQAVPPNASPSLSAATPPVSVDGRTVTQAGAQRAAITAGAASTSEAAAALPPPCIDGICLGASIQTLNAPFEPLLTLGEQLRSGLTLHGTLPPNAEESFKRMEALYRKGDKEGLEREAMTWPTSYNSGRDQLLKNLFHLVQAYELAEQALGGKRNADTVALAMYFVPQPVNRKEGFRGTVNIKANPMGFATGSSLNFDLGLPKLMAKTKPTFCGAFRLEGYYESKSGYPTTVAVQTDSDGDFKVITMQRLFTNASRDSVQQLHEELAQRYASAIKANIAKLKTEGSRVQLSFMHPIMIQGVGAGADEASKLFQALWQQGWMDFKGKNAGLLGAMNTIASHNKSSIAACKPKALPLD